MNYKRIVFVAFCWLWMSNTGIFAQDLQKDSTGLPGDNFSLQGALDLFSKADNLEAFEKSINEEKNNVNNLDLNGDGKIDYIRVIDRAGDDAHAIVLQAVVGENENQDIAVIEIEKKGENDAIAQIVGDEDIYGKEVYVEAKTDDNATVDENGAKVKNGPAPYDVRKPVRVYFNVWAWPCVRYIYSPVYVVYVSPWHWYTYPRWWNPWRPVFWHTFYPRTWGYHHHCVVVYQPRVYKARAVYAPTRTVSRTVYNRNVTTVNNYRTRNNIVIDRNDNRHRNQAGLDTRDSKNRNNAVTPSTDSRNRQNGNLDSRNNTTRTRTERNNSRNENTNTGRERTNRNVPDNEKVTRDRVQPTERPTRSEKTEARPSRVPSTERSNSRSQKTERSSRQYNPGTSGKAAPSPQQSSGRSARSSRSSGNR